MSVSALLLLTAGSHAADPAPEQWRVFLEARFFHVPSAKPISAAERTDLAAGEWREGALEPLSKAAFEKLGTTWEDFQARAQQNSAAELAQIRPIYVRNRRKVIEYAELHSDLAFLPSAVLAPGFRALFDDTLGPTVLLVIPNQTTAYVFPKLASSYQDYAPMVQRAYHATSHPVSLEVFEISEAGLRAIGAYPDLSP